MKKLIAAIFILNVISNNISAQTWNTTGNSGTTPGTNFIGTTDAKDFVFKTNGIEKGRIINNSGWRFGGATNNCKIDSTGKLTFSGTGAYQVAGNKYAFQFSGNPNYGLYFNQTGLLYEFRTSTALSVFSVGANTGNGIFKGNLKIGAYTLPSTDGTSGQVLQTNGTGTVTWQTVSVGSGANTSLSNLATTSINQSLLAGTDNSIDLGSSTKKWRDIYFGRKIYFNGSLFFHNTGTDNFWLGEQSGIANTTGYSNFAVGSYALTSNTIGFLNTAVGINALYTNENGWMNTAVGEESLLSNVDGLENVGVGYASLGYNSSGNYNTAVGTHALFNNTASGNTAIGNDALRTNTIGNNNTAVGIGSLTDNIEGYFNTAIGSAALGNNDYGSYNTAVGKESLLYNTSGSSNVAVGSSSMYLNETGTYNAALGNSALQGNVSGAHNCAIGALSLYTNSSGNYNIGVGENALYNLTSTIRNTAVGSYAGDSYDPGNYNTYIGAYSDAVLSAFINSTAIGDNSSITGSNMVRLGDAFVTSIGGQVGWTTLSDGRFKKNVKEDVVGLDFINQLRPVTYNVDVKGLNQFLKIPDSVCNKPGLDEKEKIIYSGFIAQEVEASAKKVGYDFSGVDAPKNENDYYGLRYGDFVVPVVKSIQELSSENDSLKTENEEQKIQIEDLNSKLDAMMNKMNAFENSLSQCCSSYQSSSSSSSSSQNILGQNGLLEQNVPNPFNQNSYIKYFAPSTSHQIEIVVSDLNGRVIKSFLNLNNGFGTVNISAGTFAAGTYQYSLFIDGNKIDTKEMVIVK